MRSSGGVGVGESAMSVVCLQPPPAGGGTGRFRGQKKPEKQGSPPRRRGGGETVDYIGKSVGNRPRRGGKFVAIVASVFSGPGRRRFDAREGRPLTRRRRPGRR